MHLRSLSRLLLLTSLLVAVSASAQNNPCNVISQGPEGSLNGFVPFPASSLWNTNISSAPVDPNSDAMISFIGSSKPLHPDFGSGLYQGHTFGIPYIVVPIAEPFINLSFTSYGSESDPGPIPIPMNAPIEGYPNPTGDRHVLVLDKGNCWLYELFGAYEHGFGLWTAASGAVWDLRANEQRPYGWTSADAAGLPIFPGLVRYDEVTAGHINHAIRLTLQYTGQAFTPPASHWAATSSNPLAAPMGMRLRLKASIDISSYPPEDQVVLTALKQYGAIVADNGTSMFIGGTTDSRWNNDHLQQMRGITASDFEVIQISPLYTPQNLPTGPNPAINSFTTTTSGGRGQPVTLNWTVTNGEYYIVAPSVGAIRGNSVVVYPTLPTVYTLYATNQYGRSTKTVLVNVH